MPSLIRISKSGFTGVYPPSSDAGSFDSYVDSVASARHIPLNRKRPGIHKYPLRVYLCSKYPPAEPEALWVAAPSKGADRDPKSKSQDPNSSGETVTPTTATACVVSRQSSANKPRRTPGTVKLWVPPRQSRGVSRFF